MQISVELTLSPLQTDFETPIKDFIKKLRASGLTVIENPLSTQVYGEYDAVMNLLHQEIKESFQKLEHAVVFMKVVTSNRSHYEPSF
jgi:uncharacterized protein YqgV (UPF0045/DUF77 family)